MLVSSRFGQRVYNHVKRMEKSEYIILLERFLKGETTHDRNGFWWIGSRAMFPGMN